MRKTAYKLSFESNFIWKIKINFFFSIPLVKISVPIPSHIIPIRSHIIPIPSHSQSHLWRDWDSDFTLYSILIQWIINNEAQKLDRASGSSLASPARSSARRPFRAWSSSSKLAGMWAGLTKAQARSSAMRASELHFGRKFWEFWLLWLKFFLKIRMFINSPTLNLM
jgi:hypothetical protein